MNEAAISAMADAMVSAGHATPSQAAEWKTSDLAALNALEALGGPPAASLTPIQQRAANLVKSGGMTQAQADAALALYNDAPLPADAPQDAHAAPAEAPASPGPYPFDGVELPDGFGPPPKATDYRLDALISFNLPLQELRDVADALHDAKLPIPIATQIVSEIASCATQRLDEKGLRLQQQRTLAQLRSVWGDATDSKVATAVQFVKQWDRISPGLIDLLNATGAGNSAIVIRQLVEHAERIAAARRK